ncbi:MAG: hypothetical protein ACE5EL_07040 [Anaerolineae bacterium]
MTTRATTILLLAALAIPSGCHTPAGGIMPSNDGSITYYSTEMRPATVRLIDIRNGDEVFGMDIPPGKQLTIYFERGRGDDPVYTPDLMRWEVWPIGTTIGQLRNALTVPAATARRIELEYRSAPEYASAPARLIPRADQAAGQPPWWTPEGGQAEADPRGLQIYDD